MYFKSYTECIQKAKESFIKQGYHFNEDELVEIIGFNSKRPDIGETERVSIPLYRNNKLQKKMGHIQVFGMPHSFELNHYIL
jgi:hypothetical protein